MISGLLKKLIAAVLLLLFLGGGIYLYKSKIEIVQQQFESEQGRQVNVESEQAKNKIVITTDGKETLDTFLKDQKFWDVGVINSPVYFAQSGRFQIKGLNIKFVNTPQTSLIFRGTDDLGSVGQQVEPETGIVTISVYVAPLLQNQTEPRRSSFISSMVLQGIYRVLHPIFGDLSKQNDVEFEKYISNFEKENKKIFDYKETTSFSLVSEVLADSCGNYHYDLGAARTNYYCSDNMAKPCNNPVNDCSSPGASCQGLNQCVIINAGGGNCIQVFGGNGFAGCAPGNLGNCDNGNCPGNIQTGGSTGPVCGNGICEAPSGETNATCPADCTSSGGSSNPGNTCSGACFGGLNNCGEVGRQPASGSCSNGEMCCGFGSGGGGPTCRIWDHPVFTVQVGETRYLNLDGFLYGDIILGSNAVLSNPGIADANPLNINLCCSTSWGDYTLRFMVTGLVPGQTWLTDRWGTSANNDTGSCTNSVLIVVVANSTTPAVTLRANGTTNATSVASGSDVTLDWFSANVTSCTASDSWSGSKTLNGTELQTNITTNGIYTLTCTGPNGTVSDTVNVNVIGLPVLPTVDLKINNSPSQVVFVPPVPGPPWPWPWPINVVFKWTTTNATSCVGVSRPHNYVYPQNILLGPMIGWFLWDWTLPVNSVGSNTTLGPVFYDLNCTGPGGRSTATVEVIPGTIPPVITQCAIPAPKDPPTSVCAPTPTSNGSITWRWAPVAGANQYTFEVQSVPSLLAVAGTNTGIKPAAFFNCTALECSYTTSLPTGRYRSSIIASSSTSACTPSTAGNSAPFDLGLCPVNPWWQGGTGNVISKGLITSQVPYNTMSFLTDGTSGVPGLAAGTSINTGSGTISSTGWSTDSVYSGTVPTYDDFYGQVPSGTTFIDPGANISNPATLTSGGTADAAGFIWYKHTGDVTIGTNVTIPAGRKEVLFVDGGDVTINGTIQFANRANSFFMVVVNPTAGGTKGNIVVAPTVTAPAGTPAIEGMFCAKHLSTGVGSTPLVFRGSVVVTNGVTLERDLAAGNNAGPAESFIQSPELIFNYPPALTFKRLSWQEVAP